VDREERAHEGDMVSIEDYYTETIKVVSITNSTNEFSTVKPAESCSTFMGAINPSNGAEYFTAGRNFPDADYKLFCSDDVSIDEQDRILWGGDTFNVVFVKDTFNMGHHKKVLLKRNV